LDSSVGAAWASSSCDDSFIRPQREDVKQDSTFELAQGILEIE
jgi:hypothetical protein